jgi:hypothetical protein
MHALPVQVRIAALDLLAEGYAAAQIEVCN